MRTARRGSREADLRRWRRYLADERAEAAVYRDLAGVAPARSARSCSPSPRRRGATRPHWRELLGDDVGAPRKGDLRTRLLGFLARRFGSVFVLALAQRAEIRLALRRRRGRHRRDGGRRTHPRGSRARAGRPRSPSGSPARSGPRSSASTTAWSATSRSCSASGPAVSPAATVLFTGVAGLLAGALSMGAGEFVSVRSQRELLEASTPNPATRRDLGHLDAAANELTLVYRAQGMSAEQAEIHAREVLRIGTLATGPWTSLRRWTSSPGHHRRGRTRRRTRGGRHRPRRRAVELLLLRLRRAAADPALAVRPRRDPGGHRRDRARRSRPARHRRHRGAALRRPAAAPGAPPAAHRPRGGRRHLRARAPCRRVTGVAAAARPGPVRCCRTRAPHGRPGPAPARARPGAE